MTKAKPKSEWKQRNKEPQVGPPFKLCLTCGKRIEREGVCNAKWIRRAYCNKACHFAGINTSPWSRRRAV